MPLIIRYLVMKLIRKTILNRRKARKYDKHMGRPLRRHGRWG